MTRLFEANVAALCLAAVLAASSAEAQFRLLGTDPVTAELQTPGFSAADCQSTPARAVKLFYDGTSSGRNIHFWRGTVSCDAEDARDGNPDNGVDCDLLFQIVTTGSEGEVERSLTDFVDCLNGETVVWAIVTDQADGSGPSSDVASVTFAVDTDVPGAPASIVSTAAGESLITVTWDSPNPEPADINGYNVYGQADGCNGSADGGTSGSLVGGGTAPGTESALFLQSVTGREANINPDSLGLGLGESASVAVSVFDIAGNEGALSSLSCITRVQTEGFCDALRREGGNCEDCSVAFVGHPGGRSVPLWAWLLLLLAGAAAFRHLRRVGALLIALAIFAMPSSSFAQFEEESLDTRSLNIESAESVQFSLKGGPYEPDGGDAFEQVFGSELGPLLALEFNVFVFHLEGIGALGVASGFGWADYSANATAVTSTGTAQVTETTDLTLFPVPVLATIRVDVLSRQWDIPFVFTGKLGPDFVFWTSSTGGRSDAENVSIGLHWAVEVALELDWFDRRAMRSLDDEWGINHALLFAELFGSTASSTLPVGPDAGWALRGGLALVF